MVKGSCNWRLKLRRDSAVYSSGGIVLWVKQYRVEERRGGEFMWEKLVLMLAVVAQVGDWF